MEPSTNQNESGGGSQVVEQHSVANNRTQVLGSERTEFSFDQIISFTKTNQLFVFWKWFFLAIVIVNVGVLIAFLRGYGENNSIILERIIISCLVIFFTWTIELLIIEHLSRSKVLKVSLELENEESSTFKNHTQSIIVVMNFLVMLILAFVVFLSLDQFFEYSNSILLSFFISPFLFICLGIINFQNLRKKILASLLGSLLINIVSIPFVGLGLCMMM